MKTHDMDICAADRIDPSVWCVVCTRDSKVLPFWPVNLQLTFFRWSALLSTLLVDESIQWLQSIVVSPRKCSGETSNGQLFFRNLRMGAVAVESKWRENPNLHTFTYRKQFSDLKFSKCILKPEKYTLEGVTSIIIAKNYRFFSRSPGIPLLTTSIIHMEM